VEIFVVLRDSVYGSLSKRPPLLLLAYGPIFKQYTWTNPPCSASIQSQPPNTPLIPNSTLPGAVHPRAIHLGSPSGQSMDRGSVFCSSPSVAQKIYIKQRSTFREKMAPKFSDLVANTSILVAKNFRPFGSFIFFLRKRR